MHLDRIAFRYRLRAEWVLRDVTMAVPRGRLIEVNGANGAGKSTLLRLLAGIARPDRGRITGRPAPVGYAPERFPVGQPFTARGYLARMAAIRGGGAFEPWADRLGLTALLGTRLPDLSKGSAHKVGLAQALMAAPELLVLDEPFAGLDAETRATLPSVLRDLASDGTTIIVSDHQGDLRELPDVIHWQVTGHTVTEGDRPQDHVVAGKMPPHVIDGQPAGPNVIDGDLPEGHAVVEVVLPTAEADDLVTRLGADGYSARRRPVPSAPRPGDATPPEVPSARRPDRTATGEGHRRTETTAAEPPQGETGPAPRRDATAPGRDGNGPVRDRGPGERAAAGDDRAALRRDGTDGS